MKTKIFVFFFAVGVIIFTSSVIVFQFLGDYSYSTTASIISGAGVIVMCIMAMIFLIMAVRKYMKKSQKMNFLYFFSMYISFPFLCAVLLNSVVVIYIDMEYLSFDYGIGNEIIHILGNIFTSPGFWSIIAIIETTMVGIHIFLANDN